MIQGTGRLATLAGDLGGVPDGVDEKVVVGKVGSV